MSDTEYVPQHMEGEPKHAAEPNRNYIPILRAGSELEDQVLVGRATKYEGSDGFWIFEILPQSGLNEFIQLGELKCFSLSATVANFDMDAMEAFWEKDAENVSLLVKHLVPEKALIGPQVWDAIRFTGKNGKEVRDFLRDSPMVTRAGNGWVKIADEVFKAGSWFMLSQDGSLMVQDDSGLKQFFKRVNPKDATRYMRKDQS